MNLSEFRKEAGLTQKDVSEYLSCSLSTYVKYEIEEREPFICLLSALADLYYISIDELVGHEVKRHESNHQNQLSLLLLLQPEDYPIDDLAHLK